MIKKHLYLKRCRIKNAMPKITNNRISKGKIMYLNKTNTVSKNTIYHFKLLNIFAQRSNNKNENNARETHEKKEVK